MKTQYKIYFWMLPVEPCQNLKGDRKVFLNLYSTLSENDFELADSAVENKIREIMNQYDWGYNMNWKICEVTECKNKEDGFFELEISPQHKRNNAVALIKEKQIKEFEQNLPELEITKKDVEFDEKESNIVIKNKLAGDIKIPINEFYQLIETKTPDAKLTNSFGEVILSLENGSFLNAGLADIQVFESKKKADNSFFNNSAKGGIFIREDGRLHFGDMKRTKFMEINLSNLAREYYLKKFANKEIKSIDLIKKLTA